MVEADTRQIGLLGAGGQAIELRGYSPVPVAFCAIEARYIEKTSVGGLVFDISDVPLEFRDTPVVVAVGAPGAKRALLSLWGGAQFTDVIASSATIAEDAVVGRGSTIAPGARVMARAVVGAHVLVNTNAVVSHETIIGDFGTISPGVTIGGRCALGAGVFVGIGATILDNVTIGHGAVIGAGALVRQNVGAFEVVVGTPARSLRVNKEWLHEI